MRTVGNRYSLESPTLGATVRQASVDGFRLTESAHPAATHVSLHAHRLATIYFTLSGSFLEVSAGRELECEPRSVVFRPAEKLHEDRMGRSDVRFFILELGAEKLCGLPDWIGDTSVTVGTLSAYAFGLYDAFRSGDSSLALRAEELCLQFSREARLRTPDARSAAARRVRAACEYIRENFRRPLRVEEIARAAGVHPVYLARLFRRSFGCSIAGFLRARRVDDAARRLLRGGESLAEIALSTGFSDQSHFTREFRREAGRSPARFRRASRQLSAGAKAMMPGCESSASS